MREEKSKPNAIASDNAVVSVCENARQRWEELSLAGEIGIVTLETDVTSYAGLGACEKGGNQLRCQCQREKDGHWPEALSLLRDYCSCNRSAGISARARSAISGSGLWRCSARFGRQVDAL